jgi:hypothetical protein
LPQSGPGSREAKHAIYKDVEKELTELEEKLKRLVVHRSVGEVEAAIVGILKMPVVIDERVRGTIGRRSANCGNIDWRTAEACAKVAALREELAVTELDEWFGPHGKFPAVEISSASSERDA